MLITDKNPLKTDVVLGALNPQPSLNHVELGGLDKYKLRNYQEELISRVEASWKKGNRRVMLQLATGGGKTIVFSYLVKKFLEENIRTLVVAHKKELITQAYDKLTKISGLSAGYLNLSRRRREILLDISIQRSTPRYRTS